MSKTIQFDRYKTMTSIFKGDLAADKKRTLINDDMKAEGIQLEWFTKPSSKKDAPVTNETVAHHAHYDATRAAVFNGFDADIKKLINKPINEVPEGNASGQKGTRLKKDDDGNIITNGPAIGTRLYWQMQIGTGVKQFGKSYATYLAAPKERGANGRRDDNVEIPKMVADLQKRIDSSKTFTGDAMAMIDWLEDCPIKY